MMKKPVEDKNLTTARSVFVRYGYQKTSMADVAREMGISRQALYKKYGSKSDLFHAIGQNFLMLAEYHAALIIADEKMDIREKIETAFDQWSGRIIEELRSSPHSYEIMAIAEIEMGDKKSLALSKWLKEMIEKSGYCQSAQELDDIVVTLMHVGMGLFYKAKTREQYKALLKQAVRTIFK